MDITEIFTNPLVWAALAWLFSRVFTSKTKEDETNQKQPTKQTVSPQDTRQDSRPSPRPNPRPNPRTSSRPNPRPVPKPVMTTVETKPREENRPPLQTVQEAYEKMKRNPVKDDRVNTVKERLGKPQALKEEKLPKVNRNVNRNQLIVDQQSAAQGVIWSEILGPPRSKNPHYTQNKRRL
ncbi:MULTISPECIES: hypothetical protein [Bacillaceae]|uniref:hypothetical protein n=1 Tax=Bacillaceae TaxID=186817 RepID=UPI000BFD4E9C|nr:MULTISPECIES: hypothetical protein [Bacillaceae]PGT82900.1 hypothetical protein COD11_13895 [Bacillus sp. AFS040349]UGB29569.1 hypothetical protein LPC09_17720 [Metabacillus sp. B2-18]